MVYDLGLGLGVADDVDASIVKSANASAY